MPLVKCPECGHEASSYDEPCPDCGCLKTHLDARTLASARRGDRISLGRWGGEDIEWRVLAVEGGRALLIAECGIDVQPFNKNGDDGNDWETCSLKGWLEREFGPGAGLSGNPFLLSVEEARQYFEGNEDWVCRATDHAKRNGASTWKGACYWWLRSAGFSGYYASYVGTDGCVNTNGSVDFSGYAVRPALWVNL